jgi:hypothetical protein
MSKKTIFIIIAILIVAGAVVGGIYFFKKSNTPTGTSTTGSDYKIFNPFGTSEPTGSTSGTTNQIVSNVKQTNKFYRITDFAIAGAAFFQNKKVLTSTEKPVPTINPKTKKVTIPAVKFELIPSLRYVAKENGHIYSMDIATKNVQKISNTTIPGIEEVLFNKEATSLIYRYASLDRKTINSFLTTMGSTKSEFLPLDILGVATSPDKSKFFYFMKSNNGVVGYMRAFGSTQKTQVLSNPYTEWIPQWISESKIYLTTKASYSVPGILFSLDTKTKTLTKVLGGVRGLTTLSNSDGSRVLYGVSANDGPRLNIFNVKEHSTTSVDTYGLPEKCVWGKSGLYVYCAVPNTITGTQYPDSWYQGLVSFSDRFIKIDVASGNISDIINSEDITAVDATNLFLSENEEQLFFTNKKDSTLWGLNLY